MIAASGVRRSCDTEERSALRSRSASTRSEAWRASSASRTRSGERTLTAHCVEEVALIRAQRGAGGDPDGGDGEHVRERPQRDAQDGTSPNVGVPFPARACRVERPLRDAPAPASPERVPDGAAATSRASSAPGHEQHGRGVVASAIAPAHLRDVDGAERRAEPSADRVQRGRSPLAIERRPLLAEPRA